MPFPPSSSPFGGGPSGAPLNLSPSVGSDGPRHYTTGYISSTHNNFDHFQSSNNFAADLTADQDDWVTYATPNGRLGGSNGPGSTKSSYRAGGLFAPKDNMPLRNSRSTGLFGSNTKLAHSVKSKRLSDALEDDAPPKESLFDDDLSPLQPRQDPSAHRMTSSLSSNQLQNHQAQADPAPDSNPSSGYKVFVFGFVQSQQSFVLKHFTSIGDLLHAPEPSLDGGNWVTLTYKYSWAAQRAVRKNGEVLGGVIMVGCKPVDEFQLGQAEPVEPTGHTRPTSMIVSRPVKTFEASDAVFAGPAQAREAGIRGLVNGAGKPNPAIFRKSAPDSAEGAGSGSSSYVNRALDLIFGW